MALVSCSPRPAPGSFGALDAGGGGTGGSGRVPACAAVAVAVASVADAAAAAPPGREGDGNVPACRAALYQRRSDSVVVPTDAATSPRAMPSTTRCSAALRCSGVNRRPRSSSDGAFRGGDTARR
jgi:hypothetical protein